MEISTLSRKILRELCTDSRVNVTELSKRLGVSRFVVARHIQSLEKELGLRYTMSLNYNALGFTKMNLYHMTFSKKPNDATLEAAFSKSKAVQLALRTKGDFDVVLFVLAGNEEEYAKWHLSLALEFSKYGVSINKSDIDIIHHGFVPLTNAAIEDASAKDLYKGLLLKLNSNSRMKIKEIAHALKMNEDMVSYYMAKLVKEGVIRKFTTIITKPPSCMNILFFMRYIYREGHVSRIYEKRKLVYFKKEDEIPMFNDYQMVLSISGGEEDFAWGSGATMEEAKERVSVHEKIFKKDSPEMRAGMIVKVLKGYQPIRSVDIKSRYRTTQWAPGENYTG